MSLTLTRMRVLVRRGLGGLDSDDLGDTDLDEMLNMSLWELEDKYPFEAKETVFTSTLVLDQVTYGLSTLTTLDAITSVSWVDSNGESQKLETMTRSVFDTLFDDATSNSPSGPPEQYLREGVVLTIWPPPSSDEDAKVLQIALKESVASLSGGSDTTGLPRNWDELVVYGAIARGHFLNNDYDKAREARDFEVGITRSTVPTESKEAEDARWAGLDVAYGRPGERGSGDDVFNPRVSPPKSHGF
jgi:hypothetical protein